MKDRLDASPLVSGLPNATYLGIYQTLRMPSNAYTDQTFVHKQASALLYELSLVSINHSS
jgi:hypothetical protein